MDSSPHLNENTILGRFSSYRLPVLFFLYFFSPFYVLCFSRISCAQNCEPERAPNTVCDTAAAAIAHSLKQNGNPF